MAMKGFIFTTDAILAIAIVVILISSATLLTFYQSEDYSKKTLMDMIAGEKALNAFYGGEAIADLPTEANTKCTEIFEYDKTLAAKITAKVKKCQSA